MGIKQLSIYQCLIDSVGLLDFRLINHEIKLVGFSPNQAGMKEKTGPPPFPVVKVEPQASRGDGEKGL